MALWGRSDAILSTGTISVDYSEKTITGTGTSFGAAGISTGTVITIGVGGTFGQAVISGVTSERKVSIATTQYLTGAVISGVAYTMSEKPIYTLEDTNYSGIQTTSPGLKNDVYGVDEYEAQSVVATKYKVAHAGWVGVHTYIDCHGTLRVKSEVLVAMSGITTGLASYSAAGDASDDAQFPDRLITFTTQPSNRIGIETTSATTFAAVVSVTPTETPTYQWQYSVNNVGAAYTDLTATNIYSNVTTATLGIAATTVSATRPDGYYFRVVVSAPGATNATSDAAQLTYA